MCTPHPSRRLTVLFSSFRSGLAKGSRFLYLLRSQGLRSNCEDLSECCLRSRVVLSELYRYTVSRDHPTKTSVVAMPRHKQTRRDLVRDSHPSLRWFRLCSYGMTFIRSLVLTIFRQNRDVLWYGCCMLITGESGAFQSMITSAAHFKVWYSILIQDFAAYPRYAKQPIACFARVRVPLATQVISMATLHIVPLERVK